jgi:hypothetical protein
VRSSRPAAAVSHNPGGEQRRALARPEGRAVTGINDNAATSCSSESDALPDPGAIMTPNSSQYFVIRLAVYVGIPTAALLVILWISRPMASSLEFEAAKACLQILAVGVIGAAVGVVIKSRDDRIAQARRETELKAEARQRETELKAEARQHAHDHLLDVRQREDDFLMGMLNELLDAYNDVKSIRRLLDAETRDAANRRAITIAIYDKLLRDLNDQQLRFERLARLAPLCDERASRLDSGAERVKYERLFRDIEKDINKLVDEYQKHRYEVAVAGSLVVSRESLPELYALVEQRWIFKEETSGRVDKAVKQTMDLLLQPIAEPT